MNLTQLPIDSIHQSGGFAQNGGVERRREARFEAAQASLTARVNGIRAQLIDVSRHGLSVSIPPEAFEGPAPELSLELEQNQVRIAKVGLRVTHVGSSGDRTVLGGRIECAEVLPSGKAPLPRSGDVIEIRDPAMRSSVVERLLDRPRTATARLESGDSLEASLVRSSSDPTRLALKLAETPPASLLDQFVSIEVALVGSRFVLEATVAREAATELTLSTPRRVLSLCRRVSERVAVPLGKGFAVWSDLLDPDVSIEAKIIDVSPQGLAIELPAGCLLPPPPVPITIRIGKVRLRVLAEVHRSEPRPDGTSVLGLRIETLTQGDLIRLARVCDSLRFPTLVQRREVDPHAVAELMRASGYLDLREGTGPSQDWHNAPGDEALAIDTVFRATSGALLGHFSCGRVYPKTWILHQLATVGLRRDRIAYPLYLQLMDWIATLSGGEGYALAYFNQERSWHQTLFGSFVRWAGSEALSLIASLDRFEPSSSVGLAAPAHEGVSVREARAEDLPFAVGLARAHLPQLLCNALHLYEDSIATANLCNEHTSVGLERTRSTFLVEAQGELLGAAICETGAARLSLFNILNMAHVFFREPVTPALARAAQTALLRKVVDFYSARTGAQPLIVAPAGNAQFAAGAGLVSAETMGVWTASLGGIRQWRNYVHFSLGELAQRKRPGVPNAA